MLKINAWKAAVAIAAVAVMATSVSAAVIFSDDFEANTVGADPTGWNIFNDLDPNAPVNGSIEVASGTPTGGSGNKVFQVSRSGGPVDSFAFSNDYTDTTETTATMSFKVKFLSGSDSDFRIEANGAGGLRTYLRMLPALTTGGSAGFSYHDGTTFTSLQNITYDHWYQVVKNFDFTGNTWDISIDDLDDAAAPNVTTGLAFFSAGSPTFLSKVTLTSISATRGQSFQFDDLEIFDGTVPEPTALALGSLAVMLMSVARVRRPFA